MHLNLPNRTKVNQTYALVVNPRNVKKECARMERKRGRQRQLLFTTALIKNLFPENGGEVPLAGTNRSVILISPWAGASPLPIDRRPPRPPTSTPPESHLSDATPWAFRLRHRSAKLQLRAPPPEGVKWTTDPRSHLLLFLAVLFMLRISSLYAVLREGALAFVPFPPTVQLQ